MPYFALPNFNNDSGPNRIQSGPDHEGYIVLYSGVESTGPNNGVVVGGAPLSGSPAGGTWDYDSNWRYVPSTLPSQSGSLDPTPYNVSGALDTYNAARIYTRDNVAGAQAASAIGPETGKVNPRGGALQPRANVTKPETYMYFGGGAPDNQDYSPYNTPDANTAAEGKTGGGVTHRSYESSLLTNLLGSQGTSDRSQWRYHQPVYCKTFTETQRSATPGLMSSPLRYIYRGSATSYNYNYGGELLANKGGFELLPYDDQTFGCPFPVGCPTNSGSPDQIIAGDVLSAVVYCDFVKIEWFNSNNDLLGEGLTYTTTESDVGYRIYYKVTYNDGSIDSSSLDCFPIIIESSLRYWFQLKSFDASKVYSAVIEPNGDLLLPGIQPTSFNPVVFRVSNEVSLQWKQAFNLDPSFVSTAAGSFGFSYFLLDSGEESIDFLAWQYSSGGSPYFRDYPIRIYRYRLNKLTGVVLDVVAVDWNPPVTFPSFLYFYITDVKLDSTNNYYFVGRFQINAEVATPCILKFSSTLSFIWCRVAQRIKYRNPGSGPVCSIDTSDGSLAITVDDDQIIGSCWRDDFEYMSSPYFCLDLDGNTLNKFKGKLSQSDVDAADIFYVRSVCRDLEGNIYGVGGYDGSVALGRFSAVIVYKETPNDVTIWAKDIRNTFFAGGLRPTINVTGNQLIVVDSKLVFIAPWERSIGGSVTHLLLVFVFNVETGAVENCFQIEPPNEIGDDVIIQRLPEENKFLIQTSNGYRIRLSISDLPSTGSFICTDNPSLRYNVSGVVPVTSNAGFFKFSGCGASSAPDFITRDLSSYFTTVSPVVTTSGLTGETFRHFAGQDTP